MDWIHIAFFIVTVFTLVVVAYMCGHSCLPPDNLCQTAPLTKRQCWLRGQGLNSRLVWSRI